MKNKLLAGFLFICLNVAGQGFAIIDDKDGYTNIREKPNSNSKIVGRVFENDIFFAYQKDKTGDWYSIDYGGQIPKLLDQMEPYKRDYYKNELHYNSNNVEVEGYVHQSRVILMSNLQKVGTKSITPSHDHLIIKNDTLIFDISTSNFDESKHKIQKSEDGSARQIDNLCPMGLLDKLPKMDTKYIKLSIGSTKNVIIPSTEFSDLYELDLNRVEIMTDKRGVIYIQADGSDGFAGYTVIWIIKKHKYLKREIFTD